MQSSEIMVGEPFTFDDRAIPTDCRVFVWDVKAHLTNPSAKAHSLPFGYTPPFDLTHLKRTMSSIFGTSQDDENKLFRKTDVAFFLDGRVASISNDLVKVLKASLKQVKKEDIPSRNYMSFTYFYHNREFASGYAKPRSQRSAFNACMPTHNETALVVVGKAFDVAVKERRWIDLPGSNRSRGWADNALVEEGEHIFVPYGRKAQMSKLPSGAATDGMLLEGTEDETAADVPDDSASSIAYPWSAREIFWREFWNALPDKHIIMTSTPSPFAAMAAARLRKPYFGWVGTACEKQIMLDSSSLA